MRIVLVSVIFISTAISAQQKDKKTVLPKMDTAKVKTFTLPDQNLKPKDLQKEMYKMPSAKPDESLYSSLKDNRKDSTDYKMLNAMIPEKKEDDK